MFLSEVAFASCMAYSVRGEGELAEMSRFWRDSLKYESLRGSPPRPMSSLFAARLLARLDETSIRDVLSDRAVLVPVPSSRLLRPGSLWVPLQLAKALVAVGLGRSVEPCLERSAALPKAATSVAKHRPTAQQHYETLRARTLLFPPDELVLIDDVITRGATMLGAANRLQEAFPRARIRGFAAMRAISDPTEFTDVFAPCVGAIRLRDDGSTARRP